MAVKQMQTLIGITGGIITYNHERGYLLHYFSQSLVKNAHGLTQKNLLFMLTNAGRLGPKLDV